MFKFLRIFYKKIRPICFRKIWLPTIQQDVRHVSWYIHSMRSQLSTKHCQIKYHCPGKIIKLSCKIVRISYSIAWIMCIIYRFYFYCLSYFCLGIKLNFLHGIVKFGLRIMKFHILSDFLHENYIIPKRITLKTNLSSVLIDYQLLSTSRYSPVWQWSCVTNAVCSNY